jgi:transposase
MVVVANPPTLLLWCQLIVSQHHKIEELTRQNQELLSALAAQVAQNQELLAKLQQQAIQSQSQLEQVQTQVTHLDHKLKLRERKLFGKSSEKLPKEKPAQESAEKKPRVGHGPTPQPDLPVVEVIHRLDEADQICPKCGGQLKEWPGNFEISEEITVIPEHTVRKIHKRQKYRCQNGDCIETALGPQKLFSGARYTKEFVIEVILGKYADHLPLDRQTHRFLREGLEVTTQTLWDLCEFIARLLEEAYRGLQTLVFGHPVIGADETRWYLLVSKKEGGPKTWYVWGIVSPTAVFYLVEDNRSQEAAKKILEGYQGIVMVDCYEVYIALSKKNPDLILVHCWAHGRRKFVEVGEAGHAMVLLIGELYGVEAEAEISKPGDLEYLGKLRNEKSREIIKRIKEWCQKQKQQVLPSSPLFKAIAYLENHWAGLIKFLENPRIPLDNNESERAMRSIVVGRKNHYGSRSQRGTQVAAIFYSLIETCKLVGINPRAYLSQAVDAALNHQPIPLPQKPP